MKKLASDFESRGFTFHQIDRQGAWALFRKVWKHGTAESFEVVKVQRCKAHTWPNWNTTPAHESMPCSESWGTSGWSYSDLQSARRRLASEME